jgi:copper chaperone
MGSHEYLFNVAMSCSGCSGAVNRALNKLEGMCSRHESLFGVGNVLMICIGVNDVKITLESQEVVVKTNGDVSYDAVLNQIKKSGKEVRSGEVIA